MPDNNNTQSLNLANIDWQAAATISAEVVTLLLPVVNVLLPEAAVGISMGAKIVIGVINNVPEAIKLYEDIKSGKEPSAQELIEYGNSYEAAYQELNNDIAAKIAAKQSGVS